MDFSYRFTVGMETVASKGTLHHKHEVHIPNVSTLFLDASKK